ncbi:MAG: hypothetical protein HYR55_11320 [Acidobacteria bacterium]|nr:hypothetical protein [Acidobacteriota bacterium]MBI3655053.1 hypothetical protein [Acidobacteriota bacterium]
MTHTLALSGSSVSCLVGVIAAVSLPSYLILIAAYKGFFRHYTILYMYLFAATLCTGLGALALWVFGINSNFYSYSFYFSKAPLILFKFLVICWLFWYLFSRDYPSVRFSFLLVFLVTIAIFLLYFSTVPHTGACPCRSRDVLAHVTYCIEQYFTAAQMLLLTIFGALVIVFRVSIDNHLKGISLGLAASFILNFGYRWLRTVSSNQLITYFHPVPYLGMLIIFCFYLSSEVGLKSQCTARRLKRIDDRLFDALVTTGLFNRFTDRYFFGFFDRKTPADFDRWKQFRKQERLLGIAKSYNADHRRARLTSPVGFD